MNNSQPSESDKLKLLIVDDEPIICEGLRFTIDWESLGIHVVGVAYDGEEALRMIESEEINLLLTDIRMEGMDGLKLTEQLNQRFPDIRVIVISGYESFDYARQALRMNVSDYLLKPVEIDELIAIVSKVVEGIRRDTVNGSAGEEELWLANCIHNGPSQQAETPPSYLSGNQYRILTTQLGDFAVWRAEQTSSQYEDVQQQWLMHVQHSLKKYSIRCISVFDDQNLLYTLAIPNESLSSEQWIRAFEEMLRNWPGDRNLYCGVSDVYASPRETGIRCREAAETLGYHALEDVPLLLPEYRVLMDNNRALPTYNDAKNIQTLVSALFKQDYNELQTQVEEMFVFYRRHRFLLSEIAAANDELFTLLRQRLRQSGVSDIELGRNDLIDLNAYNSYKLVQAIVMEEMGQLFQLIDKNGIDKTYWIIEKVKKHLADQYRNDLKAFEVAAWLKITPSYFSFIFKQGTGKSFSEYMNELRIDHAKRLLVSTHDKVFEIAEQVGYKEYKYFVTVFKSHTGVTPKEYRKLNANH